MSRLEGSWFREGKAMVKLAFAALLPLLSFQSGPLVRAEADLAAATCAFGPEVARELVRHFGKKLPEELGAIPPARHILGARSLAVSASWSGASCTDTGHIPEYRTPIDQTVAIWPNKGASARYVLIRTGSDSYYYTVSHGPLKSAPFQPL